MMNNTLQSSSVIYSQGVTQSQDREEVVYIGNTTSNNPGDNMNSYSSNSEDNPSEGQDSNNDSDKDIDLSNMAEDLPEFRQVKACLQKLKSHEDYLALTEEWDQLQEDYNNSIGKERRKMCESVDSFQNEEIWYFVNTHLRFAAELVVQTYIQEALMSIGCRNSNQRKRPPGEDQIPESVYNGYNGLCWQTFFTLLNNPTQASQIKPEIKLPRQHTTRNTDNPELTLTGRYGTDWIDKLNELFRIDDTQITSKSDRLQIRRWDKCRFRRRTRKLMILIEHALGQRFAQSWMLSLGRLAARYLWAIPQFDRTTLGRPIRGHGSSKPQKPTKSRSQTRKKPGTLSIFVPTLVHYQTDSTWKYVSSREERIRQETYAWIKKEMSSLKSSEQDLPNLATEKALVSTLQSIDNPINHFGRACLLSDLRALFCHHLLLFRELQSRASINHNIQLRLNPLYSRDSRSPSTIGLEGRTWENVEKHIQRLHPGWQYPDYNLFSSELYGLLCDPGPAMSYMRADDMPTVSIGQRDNIVRDCDPQGTLLFPVFGDIMHLKEAEDIGSRILQQQEQDRDREQSEEDRVGSLELGEEDSSTVDSSRVRADGLFVSQSQRESRLSYRHSLDIEIDETDQESESSVA